MIFKRVTTEVGKVDRDTEWEIEKKWTKTYYLFGVKIAMWDYDLNKEIVKSGSKVKGFSR